MMTPSIVFDNVSKRFVIQHQKARSFQDVVVNFFHQRNGTTEEFWALKGVSFEVARGETMGIIGENGAGKSTILKMITRILEPTSGRVAVSGKMSALIELGAGFHPDLTGRENVYLNGSILGFSRKEMDRRFRDILEFSELERFIDTPVKHYSSGMYARLGFAVAISVDPDILIIDEVLAVGDQAFQRKSFDRIAEFRRRGKTILFVSHGLDAVELLCDRVIWLHKSVIRAQGPSVPVIRSYVAEMQRHDDEVRGVEMSHHASELDVLALADDRFQPVPLAAIQEIQLVDQDGREKYAWSTGETMRVRFHYRADDPSAAHILTTEIRRIDGLLIYRDIQRLDRMPSADESGFIDAEVTGLPLLAGTYEVAGSLQSKGAVATGGANGLVACRFSVWSDATESGLVKLPISWNDYALTRR